MTSGRDYIERIVCPKVDEEIFGEFYWATLPMIRDNVNRNRKNSERSVPRSPSYLMILVIVTMATPISLTFTSFFAGAKKNNAHFARHGLLVVPRRRQIRGDRRNPRRSPGFSRKVIADFDAGSRRHCAGRFCRRLACNRRSHLALRRVCHTLKAEKDSTEGNTQKCRDQDGRDKN